jgi:hypothetical protein
MRMPMPMPMRMPMRIPHRHQSRVRLRRLPAATPGLPPWFLLHAKYVSLEPGSIPWR